MTATTRLRLRVSPGAGSAGIVGRHGGGWEVRVAEPPEQGALPREAVSIVSGHGGRDKIVELAGVGPGLVEHRLDSVSAPARTRKDRRA